MQHFPRASYRPITSCNTFTHYSSASFIARHFILIPTKPYFIHRIDAIWLCFTVQSMLNSFFSLSLYLTAKRICLIYITFLVTNSAYLTQNTLPSVSGCQGNYSVKAPKKQNTDLKKKLPWGRRRLTHPLVRNYYIW